MKRSCPKELLAARVIAAKNDPHQRRFSMRILSILSTVAVLAIPATATLIVVPAWADEIGRAHV